MSIVSQRGMIEDMLIIAGIWLWLGRMRIILWISYRREANFDVCNVRIFDWSHRDTSWLPFDY